jgi:DNA-binding winged helix-turn-helix (wHTH) protein
MPRRRVYRFASYEADTASRELRKHGLRIPLGQKGFEVLLAVLERPVEVVTRQDLRERLWPDARFLEFDNAINSAVHRLRDALCDPAERARFIETLPSVGTASSRPSTRSRTPRRSRNARSGSWCCP